MAKMWFRRKTYGLGWTPASWQGWGVMAGYVVLIVLIFKKLESSASNGNDALLSFMVPFGALTLLLLCITYLTGEPPKWQWGAKDTLHK
jgi:hypothetical protein